MKRKRKVIGPKKTKREKAHQKRMNDVNTKIVRVFCVSWPRIFDMYCAQRERVKRSWKFPLQLDLTRFPPSHTSLYTQYFVKTNLTSENSGHRHEWTTRTKNLKRRGNICIVLVGNVAVRKAWIGNIKEDWTDRFSRLAPLSIRCKTKTDHDLVTRVFPRFGQFGCFIFEFSLTFSLLLNDCCSKFYLVSRHSIEKRCK